MFCSQGLTANNNNSLPSLSCVTCGKVITGRNRRQRMQYHLLTHSGQKNHKCPHCPYKALLKFTLDRHIKFVHRPKLTHEEEAVVHGRNLMLGDASNLFGSAMSNNIASIVTPSAMGTSSLLGPRASLEDSNSSLYLHPMGSDTSLDNRTSTIVGHGSLESDPQNPVVENLSPNEVSFQPRQYPPPQS